MEPRAMLSQDSCLHNNFLRCAVSFTEIKTEGGKRSRSAQRNAFGIFVSGALVARLCSHMGVFKSSGTAFEPRPTPKGLRLSRSNNERQNGTCAERQRAPQPLQGCPL